AAERRRQISRLPPGEGLVVQHRGFLPAVSGGGQWRQGALIQRKGLRRVALAHRELTEMIEDHGRRGALPERLIQREGLLETAVGLAWSPGLGVEPAENAQGRRLPPPVAGPPLETERPLRRGQPVPRLAGQGPRHPQLGEHAASLAEE